MDCKILIGQKSICDYLKIGKNIFYQLTSEGAPIIKTPVGWRSHTDLLDVYFKKNIISGLSKKKQV